MGLLMTPRSAIVGSVLVAGCICAWGESSNNAIPEVQTIFLKEGMPTFNQRNIEFTGGGRSFCGPTAASNALMWLSQQGYPALKPAADSDAVAQKEMIKHLAGLMGTFREGTSLTSFTCGINTYLRKAGYSPKNWVVSGNGCSDPAPPDVSLVQTLTSGHTVMWLSLGWYGLDASSQKYIRDYGHWVTLVGFDSKRQGQTDSIRFVIADPECKDGYKYITLKRLSEGRISNGRARADAKGYFNILELNSQVEGLPPKYCVLESIQALTVE
jgi:hypothetical protein